MNNTSHMALAFSLLWRVLLYFLLIYSIMMAIMGGILRQDIGNSLFLVILQSLLFTGSFYGALLLTIGSMAKRKGFVFSFAEVSKS